MIKIYYKYLILNKQKIIKNIKYNFCFKINPPPILYIQINKL